MATTNEIIAQLLDNNTGQITPALLRSVLTELLPAQQLEDLTVLANAAMSRCQLVNTVKETGTLTVVCPGSTGKALTPPDNPQPATGGNYAGYVKILGWTLAEERENYVTYDPATSDAVIGPLGEGDYQTGYAWFDFSSDTASNHVGFIGAVERDGQITFTQRPTREKLPNGGDIGSISGGSLITDLKAGDRISVWVASEKPATISVHDCNLLIEMSISAAMKELVTA